MKYLFLFLIGFPLLFTALPAQAQGGLSPDCQKTLYGNDFLCESAQVRSFCASTALPGERPDALVNTASPMAFYKSSYCNIQRSNEDEILKAVADQMNAEEPGWDRDRVQSILTEPSCAHVESFAKTSDQLPALSAWVDACQKTDFDRQKKIYDRVKTAYLNEKVMADSKASLKQQFRARELWANGSLSDAPFDLVVDLNLIEIVLFGSQAQWMDDVYHFPRKTDSADSSTENGGGNGGSSGGPGSSGETPGGPGPIECVPVNQAVCGNGSVETGEQCDDGNKRSGDGCNQSCRSEPGNTLACMDPEAVNFRPFVASNALPSTQNADSGTAAPVAINPSRQTAVAACPPGTIPSGNPRPQPSGYPGPNVGGVLKHFPATDPPECPAGMSRAEIVIAGTSYGRCVPTAFCADYEAARKLLFGNDYQKDPAKAELAASLEAFVCINIKKENRPESPYPVNEGCVDCHVLGMSDTLSKLLQGNVSCLENNMQAWGLSNRWGPNVSFNLDVTTGMSADALRRLLLGEKSDLTPAERSELRSSQILQDVTSRLDPSRTPSANETLGGAVEREDREQKDLAQALKASRAVSEAANVDRQFNTAVSPLLDQMLHSFGNLQEQYVGLATSLHFKEKKACTF